MDSDLTYVVYNMKTARAAMDECWIELETANTWEHIREVADRLSAAGLTYKQWKARYTELTEA
jgi:hypothetical protein